MFHFHFVENSFKHSLYGKQSSSLILPSLPVAIHRFRVSLGRWSPHIPQHFKDTSSTFAAPDSGSWMVPSIYLESCPFCLQRVQQYEGDSSRLQNEQTLSAQAICARRKLSLRKVLYIIKL